MSIDWEQRKQQQASLDKQRFEQEDLRLGQEQAEAIGCLQRVYAIPLLESVRDQIWGCGSVSIQKGVEYSDYHHWWYNKSVKEMDKKERDDAYYLKQYSPRVTDPYPDSSFGSAIVRLDYSWPIFVAAGGRSAYDADIEWPDHLEVTSQTGPQIYCVSRGNGKFAITTGREGMQGFYTKAGYDSFLPIPEDANPRERLEKLLLETVKNLLPLKLQVNLSISEILKMVGAKRISLDPKTEGWIKEYMKGETTRSFDFGK